MESSQGLVPISRLRLLLTSLKLGLVGFGGGMAVLSLLHREFVVNRKACDEECFLDAAALSQTLPGAISFNAMSFLGLSMCGFWGATLASWGFMLPSFLIMIGLSVAYERLSSLGAANAMLHGMVAGVVGLILAVAWDLAGKGATRCRRGWVIVLVAFVASLLSVGVVEIILGCGVAGMFLCASAHSGAESERESCDVRAAIGGVGMKGLAPLLLGTAGSIAVLGALAMFFLRVGLVTFGGGFVMIPMIQHEVVDARHWLTAKEFADGMALGQLTPGPVVITATFVGYRVAGLLGAWVASTAVFMPSYLLSLFFGYSLEKWKTNPGVAAFMNGVQPAVVGLMGAAAITLGRAGLNHWTEILVALLAFLLLVRFRLSPLLIMLGTAILGLLSPHS
jgi:chromate transporter